MIVSLQHTPNAHRKEKERKNKVSFPYFFLLFCLNGKYKIFFVVLTQNERKIVKFSKN